MSSSTERAPLLGSNENYAAVESQETHATADEIAQESAIEAIQAAEHGVDPDSSAFAPHVSRVSLRGSDEPTLPPKSEVLVIMSALWIGSFLAALDGTIVATILGTVGSEFNVSKEISWLGTSYLLTQTGFQPLYGKCSDIFGRKPATLFASAVFLIGSLLCGLSRTFTQLCLARALAGIGGGGLTTMATIVTSDLVSLKERGTYQGFGNLIYAVGASVGGPLGGALADGGLGWRWAFLIQVPLCMIHFGVVSAKVKIPPGPGSMVEKIRRIDALGGVTLVSSVSLVLLALSLGGNTRPWSDGLVLFSLFGGIALAVGFVIVEKYVAREPLMPLRVLFRQTPGAVALAALFTSVSQFGILFNIPLYFTTIERTSSSYAGLHLIPNSVLASSCSMGSGLIMAATGRYKLMLLIVSAAAAVGPLGMLFWHQGTSEWFYWAMMPWNGIGFGGILTITLVALIASVDPADMSAATGMTYLFRAVGSISGVSVSQAILQSRLQTTLSAAGLKPKIVSAIRDDVNVIGTLPHKLRQAAIGAYTESLRSVFLLIFLTAVFAFLATIPIQEFALPGSKPAQAPRREAAIAEEEEPAE